MFFFFLCHFQSKIKWQIASLLLVKTGRSKTRVEWRALRFLDRNFLVVCLFRSEDGYMQLGG